MRGWSSLIFKPISASTTLGLPSIPCSAFLLQKVNKRAPRVTQVVKNPPTSAGEVSTDFTKMPSQMEHAMETMMFTFHKFAGDKGYLTKEDLRVLMEKEFPGFLENQKDPLAVDKIMKDLDQCRDGKVGFQSFFSLIAGLTIACNDYFVVHMKQKGKK
uniref:S100 calcium binding protein A10 n=1 Tax=Ovis aries TaxID=9940 RepID=A0AC11DDE5_SHEEP